MVKIIRRAVILRGFIRNKKRVAMEVIPAKIVKIQRVVYKKIIILGVFEIRKLVYIHAYVLESCKCKSTKNTFGFR